MTGGQHVGGRTGAAPRASRAPARSLVALTGLLVRRRARRDLGLVVVVWLLVTASVAVAVLGPRAARDTLVDAVQQTVADAGRDADMTVGVEVGMAAPGTFTSRGDPRNVWEVVDEADVRLTPTLRAVVDEVVGSVVSIGHRLEEVREEPAGVRADLDLAAVAGGLDQVRVVDGRLPEAPPRGWRALGSGATPIEVAVPTFTRDALDLAVGDVVGVAVIDPSFAAYVLDLEVVGVVEPLDVGARAWTHLSDPWGERANRRAGLHLTALLPEEGMNAFVGWSGGRILGSVTLVPDPGAFTPELADALVTELRAAESAPTALAPGLGGDVSLRTGLTVVLTEHAVAARAVVAQMAVAQTGVAAVACVVLVLLARLVVLRRSGALALERARGSSVPAVALRLVAESAVVTALGVAAGLAVAHLLLPGPVREPRLLGAVVLVSVLAAPVLGAWTARRAWSGRRVAANRRERALVARRRSVQRVIAEVGVLVAAAAGVVALRGRGLLAAPDGGSDPFLAAGPVLLSAAVALVAVRVHPVLVRPLTSVGRRARGALGLVGSTQARRAVAPLPLLALTIGTAVAASGAVLVDTVREGQVQASWDRIGADVRVTGSADAHEVARVAGAPGVTAVATAVVTEEVALDLGSMTTHASLLAVDEGFADLLRTVPGAGRDLAAIERLPSLEVTEDGRLPAVVDAEVAGMIGDVAPAVVFRGRYWPLEVVGTTDHRPVGQLAGPFVYVDLATIGDGAALDPTTAWAVGEGARDAVLALDVPTQSVSSRVAWLDDRRGLERFAGVERLLVASVVVVLALGAVALSATVVVGARDRGRTLAMLRTLGMRSRAGWWLALAEVGPLVATAVLAGTGSGVLAVVVLGEALGLDVLAGGPEPPPPVVAPGVVGALVAGAVALVLLAVLTEVVVHRRDRLTDVLRVGETS